MNSATAGGGAGTGSSGHRANSWFTPSVRTSALLVIVVALLIYLPFQSVSLDDFDSFNFARALAKFDPAVGTPHAPGYVLYVALGRVMLQLTGNPRTALTLLSTLCAALACGVLFLLGTLLFDRFVGLTAFAFVLLMPVMWLNADKALSDSPGLLLQAITMLTLVLAVQRRSPLWAASLLLGIAAGFRPQAVLGAGLALLAAVLYLRSRPIELLQSAVGLLAGTLLWITPLLAAFHWNLDTLSGYLGSATGFVAAEESLFATAITAESILARWSTVWQWSSQAIYGPLFGWMRAALFGATVVLLAWGSIQHRKRIATWLCLAWLLPQLVLQLLFLNPSLTRYLLAMLFPVALLTAAGLCRLLRRRVALAVSVVLAGVIGSATLPLARQLQSALSPPEQLVSYLRTRFLASETLVVAKQSYNALSYHLAGWDIRFLDYYGTDAMQDEFARTQARYIIIADPEGLRPGEQFVEIESHSFERDRQIHAKHSHVEVIVYRRIDNLAPRDFALPENGIIQIGTEQDARYILDGWYRREEIGGIAARWTGSAPEATLRLYLPGKVSSVALHTLSYAPEQFLDVFCNDELTGQVPVSQTWALLTIPLPSSCFSPETTTLLRLHVTTLRPPSADGQSTDHRLLGIAVSSIQLLP